MSLNPDAVEERVRGARAGLWRLAGPWWLLLVTGLAWLIISVLVLRFRLSSITTVGVLIGVLFLLSMFNEFLLASVRAGWGWAHVLLGILFAVGAIWAFADPINAFWALASVLALLLIFEGTSRGQTIKRPDRRPGDQASDLDLLVAGAGHEPATSGL
jgi:uncharacterized membrane protein HdeD (DUF308 family)